MRIKLRVKKYLLFIIIVKNQNLRFIEKVNQWLNVYLLFINFILIN